MSTNLFLTGPAKPISPLGQYRALSKHASVHVSPLILGAMSIGDQWEGIGMGAMTKESSIKLLDAFFDAGGNFIDTANNYQNESSETIIGEWMENRGIRDQVVIATKYSFNYKLANQEITHKVNYHGNNAKSMHISLQDSLKKLRTTYIDLFYVHFWDYETSIEEVMNNLHNLVVSGKVLYLGISDCPAWVVAQANQYARDHGKTPFSVYQGAWNVMSRDFEREIIPMAREHGMALAPWNVLASGKLRSDAEEERREKSGEHGRDFKFDNKGWKRDETERKMAQALEKVAGEVGVGSTTAVAIAYLMHKTTYVFPIIGGRKVEQLQQNIEALSVRLSPAQIQYLESIVPFEPGFPHSFIRDGTDTHFLLQLAAHHDRVPYPSPILPKIKET